MINNDRLWRSHMTLAEIGGLGDGGVNRQALTKEDVAARKWLIAWALDRGYTVETDEIANIYISRPGSNADAPHVATGSHIDTQPSGGSFDGAYGVLAGLEVFQALDENNLQTDHPLMTIVWTNEEGSRFSPGAMGSSVFSGIRQRSDFDHVLDADGVRLIDALSDVLSAMSGVSVRKSRPVLKAYVEAHIEQGPILELNNDRIGVVTGIQGARLFEVHVQGQSAHAGTTPMASRKDALLETVHAIGRLREEMRDPSDQLRFTVGRIDVIPNSPNTIPSDVRFFIDIRHPDADVLRAKGDVIENVCKDALDTCVVKTKETFNRMPCGFPSSIVEVVQQSAEDLSLRWRKLVSGAFHDALFTAAVCPTGMIFVPSVGGISHHPAEYTDPQHLTDGARVLGQTLCKLAESGYDL